MNIKKHLNTIIFSVAGLIAVMILSHTYSKRNQSNYSINVTGSGTKDFTSDLIVWKGTFTNKSFNLKQAYYNIKSDKDRVRKFLLAKGVEANEMRFSAVNISKDYDYTYDENGNQRSQFSGFSLSQDVEIESKRVDEIESISREITDLINFGVEFYSNEPAYYYTKLASLKIEMIAEATKDARSRAEKIAENADAQLGYLKDAQMGVFQITGQNSNEDYSWGGAFNTGSKMKTATISMKLNFAVR